jgi:hypothetical protein
VSNVATTPITSGSPKHDRQRGQPRGRTRMTSRHIVSQRTT